MGVNEILRELKLCAEKRDLQWAKRIHARAADDACDSNVYVATAIIKVYGKCGCMNSARRLFDSLEQPTLVSWNTLLMGYAVNGEGRTALEMFAKMKAASGYAPDTFTYVAVVKACTSLALNGDKAAALEQGKAIHNEADRLLQPYVGSTLIDMYAKCGSMQRAQLVFDSLRNPDVVSWNTLILGYADNGEGSIALQLFARMKSTTACKPTAVTYVAALKACASLAADGKKESGLQRGREIHSEIAKETHLHCYVQSALIDMYSKCGSLRDAHSVFMLAANPDVVSWNALLHGYAATGEGEAALNLFKQIKHTPGCAPNSVTYVAAIRACTALAASGQREAALEWGKGIRAELGRYTNLYVLNALIDMYAKCGCMREAQFAFDAIREPNVVSWTALIYGYAENGDGETALSLFGKMKRAAAPNAVTYVGALKACANLAASGKKQKALEQGKAIHSEIGTHRVDHYVQSTLIDVYAKCGSMGEARQIFESLQNPDVVSWNALLMGYAENGEGGAALELFTRMSSSSTSPDDVTYMAALKACSLIGALALGRKLHSDIVKSYGCFSPHLVTCFVDFYAKCGSVAEACDVYDEHARGRELSAWNALLAGCARFGSCSFVLNLFQAMQASSGLKPDAVTLLCVMVCCSHAGLVSKARGYLEAMMQGEFGVPADASHYNVMVDALGRANQLQEAVQLIRSMPCAADRVTWMTLLGACRKWRCVEVGEWAFARLVDMDCKHGPAYVLMSHLYGSCGLLQQQQRVLLLQMRAGGCQQQRQIELNPKPF